jgi:putative membrane protein
VNPLLGILHRGGAALVLAAWAPALSAHMEPTPRLTPTPTSFETTSTEVSRDDRSFLTRSAALTRKKIVVSQAVMDQLSNPQLKSFAQQVIAEATLSGSDLMALAEQKGVEIAIKDETPLSEDWSRRTADPDHQYVAEMVSEVEYSLRVFEEASTSPDSDVAAFVRKTMPSLQRQLSAAEELQKAID